MKRFLPFFLHASLNALYKKIGIKNYDDRRKIAEAIQLLTKKAPETVEKGVFLGSFRVERARRSRRERKTEVRNSQKIFMRPNE